MLTEATSLTIVPILMFWLFSNKCLRVEVLPEPRKPAKRMVGIGFFFSDTSLSPVAVEVSEDAALGENDVLG